MRLALALDAALTTRGEGAIAISMGAFDPPTLTKMTMHIFMADKGDYYDIADGLSQR